MQRVKPCSGTRFTRRFMSELKLRPPEEFSLRSH